MLPARRAGVGPGPAAEEQQERDPGAPSGCVPGTRSAEQGEPARYSCCLSLGTHACWALGQTRFSALNPNNQTATAAEPGDRQACGSASPGCAVLRTPPPWSARRAGEQGRQAACTVALLSLLPGRGRPPACRVKGWNSLALLLSGTGSCRLQARREGTPISGICFWKRGWWERGVWGWGPPLGTGPPWSGLRCFYTGACEGSG